MTKLKEAPGRICREEVAVDDDDSQHATTRDDESLKDEHDDRLIASMPSSRDEEGENNRS